MNSSKISNETGSIVISLDFELLWGVFDKVDWTKKVDYFRNTKNVIPEILSLFDEFEIGCSWACVGMLFNSDWDEWNSNLPERLPDYDNKALSAYRFGKNFQSKKNEELCFAPNLISIIQNSENQRIGTHTYSHYYTNEKGQSIQDFDADLKIANNIAKKYGIEMASIVFPRNQLNDSYLEVCNKNGIHIARSNPDIWYWKDTEKDSLLQKIYRTGDAYLGKKDKSYKPNIITEKENVFLQPASRFFRPYAGKPMMDKLRLKRILKEMSFAAKSGEVYHLWWHPHNFGSDPTKSIAELRIILEHFKGIKNRYGFESHSMESLNETMVNV